MAKIEIDQSGKIESTNADTVIATSGGDSLLIPAAIKRECLLEMRRQGDYIKHSQIILFTVGVFLLVRDKTKKGSTLVIDEEYKGNGGLIREHLINLMKRSNRKIDPDSIQMGHVGKKSKAHELAIATYRKERKPTRTTTTQELLAELKRHKKRTGRPIGR